MSKFTKVSMNLTERDVENTEYLSKKLHSRSKADAVSAALSITTSLAEYLKKGDQLILRKKDGTTERLIIPGIG